MRRTPLDDHTSAGLGLVGTPTREQVAAAQLARLRETVAWARGHSPFYRERLAALPPAWPPSLDDLQELAFTTATDVRERGPALVCVPQDEIRRVMTLPSSGTTGEPKRIFFTAADQESIIDFFVAGMSTFVGPRDRVLILLPGGTPGSTGALLATALERLGAKPVPHGFVSNVAAASAVMRRAEVTSLVGAPVPVLALARHARLAGGTPSTLRSALLTTDHVPVSLVRRVEHDLGCEVFEHYGMSELGLGAAVECEAHDGYHLREADLYFEVIDPETGREVPEGTRGEVVVSTLTRRGMPLLRYRTGDVSRLLPGCCRCGSPSRRLERVRGRVGALAVGRGAHAVTLPVLDEALFALPGLVDYECALHRRPGSPSTLSIRAFVLGRPCEEVGAQAELTLFGLAAVREAVTAHELTLEVSATPFGERGFADPRKRVLVERR